MVINCPQFTGSIQYMCTDSTTEVVFGLILNNSVIYLSVLRFNNELRPTEKLPRFKNKVISNVKEK